MYTNHQYLVDALASHTGDGCLIWPFAKDAKLYGKVYVKGLASTQLVHRLSYSLSYGGIPQGLDGKSLNVDHRPGVCENLSCFNPRHLEAITGKERARRMGARITHCPAGHSYSDPATWKPRKDGRRDCRKCQATRDRRRNRSQ